MHPYRIDTFPSITVTGASGFLGRAVVTALRDAGFEVRGVGRSSCPGFVDILVDDYAETPDGCILVHLAEQSHRGKVNTDPTHERDTVARFDTLLSKGFDYVIYGSSMAVYCSSDRPLREDSLVCPIDGYSRAKLACERLALDKGGAVARFANLYGMGMSCDTVVWTILKQIPGSGPVEVWDTSPVRDFLAVEDAARAVATMISGGHTGVFNIGSGVAVSVAELAATMLGIAEENGREILSTKPSGVSSMTILDIGKAAEYLHWTPTIALRTGLAGLLRHRHETDL